MSDEIVDLVIRSPEEIRAEQEALVARLPPKLREIWTAPTVIDLQHFRTPEGQNRDWAVEGTINGKRYGYHITETVAKDPQAAEAALRRAAEAVKRSYPAEPIFGESNV